MTEQTKAQRLAEHYEWVARTTVRITSVFVGKDMLMEAVAELRRLDALNSELVEALRDITVWYSDRDSENEILPAINQNPEIYRAMQALAKAEGK